MTPPQTQPPRSYYERPENLPWVVGIARMAVLGIGVFGIYRFGVDRLFISPSEIDPEWFTFALTTLYGFNLCTGFFYLYSLRKHHSVGTFTTWTQVLLDFAVVAATVSFTGAEESFFTFLLVIVILEAGLLQGLAQGFLFAILSTLFVSALAGLSNGPSPEVDVFYTIFIQGLSFHFAAFISGYWNSRIYRLQQFQRDILDNIDTGFLITDSNGTIFAQNHAADDILDLPSGSAIGKPVSSVLRPASDQACPVMTALRFERDFTSYEFYALTGPGDTKLLQLTTNRLFNRRHKLTAIIAFFIDLTEVDTMRAELHRQDRMAALGELAADVAHEIRNPVAVIRGSVEELQASVQDEPIPARLAGIALRESDHLNEIVTGFLDFARNPITRSERFDLVPLAEETAALLRRTDGDDDLSVALELPEQPCYIAGDPSKIKQVFTNLGANAVEAMNGSGQLAIAILKAPGSYEIRFDDEGPGFEPDQVARIFEPFYTTKESGVGMGLAVCLRIITAHDGTIRISSREGGGTRVTVRLPEAASEEPGS